MIPRWLRSLRLLIVAAALAVSIGVALAMYWATADVFDRTVRQSATEMSASLADGTFNAMYQIMRQGWTRAQLNEFLHTIRSQGGADGAKIELYRGSKVIELFGPITQPDADSQVLSVFATGQTISQMHQGVIRYDRPLIAEAQCLHCHTNATAGNVLGVLSIAQPVAALTQKAHQDLFNRLLVIMPIPLLAALLIALLLGDRMGRSLKRLKSAISRVERVEDLAHIRFSDAHTGFSELDDVLVEVDTLTDKLRNLAVDRNLLEFEIRLLERFVITSDVVRDWRRYVRDLLREINTVLPIHGVFTAFAVGDRPPGVELFWFDATDENVAATVSFRVQQQVSETLGVAAAALVPRQHAIEPSHRPVLTNARELEIRTKVLTMDTPPMRGVVGLILPFEHDQSAVARLVIESILSTMLNVVGSVRAIEKHTEDLEFYATRDPLTQLYNQRMFWSLLDYEVGRAKRHDYEFSLLVIDMDNFKTINDTYGHAFGDLFLHQVAEQIQDSMRAGDMVARYGGDEFTAILPEAGETEARMVADRLLSRLRKLALKTPEGQTVRASLSIGIAIGPGHATTARGLFAMADNQMYRAKNAGKNQYALPSPEDSFDPVSPLVIDEQALVDTLINEPPALCYQSIFATQDALTESGPELLLQRVAIELFAQVHIEGRWHLAHEFASQIERRGQMETFDRSVITTLLQSVAVQQCERLLFVRISPRTIRAPNFLERIAQSADQAGIARNRLVLELNERESLADLTMLDRFIESLHGYGFKFAIENASSGHWIFQHLRRYAVDYIKIDAEWLSHHDRVARDRAFVDSLLGLARALSVVVIATQIQTPLHLAAARSAGIAWVQGDFLAETAPMSAAPVPGG